MAKIPSGQPPTLEQKSENFELNLAPVPSYLPFQTKLKSGKQVIIRPMTLDEVPKFYRAVQEAAGEGKGYGADELESYEYFCRSCVHKWHCLTMQEADGQRRPMGYTTFGGSVYSRSSLDSRICDSSIVILPEFRGGGIGGLLGNFGAAITKECGFEGSFADLAAINLANLINNVNIGFVCTGVIPRGIRFEGKNWVSVLCFYRLLGSECDSLINEMKNNTIRAKL